MKFLSTGREQVQSVKCCVLYGRKDGAIRHVHRVVTMEGADETPDDAVEKRTLELARQFRIDTKNTALLHVREADIEPHCTYAVDPKARRLIARARTAQAGATVAPPVDRPRRSKR